MGAKILNMLKTGEGEEESGLESAFNHSSALMVISPTASWIRWCMPVCVVSYCGPVLFGQNDLHPTVFGCLASVFGRHDRRPPITDKLPNDHKVASYLDLLTLTQSHSDIDRVSVSIEYRHWLGLTT